MRRLFICIIVLPAVFARAQNVDLSTAKTVGINFLRIPVDLELVHPPLYASPSGRSVHSLFIFNMIGSEGFVIVSASESTRPVLAYSYEQSFDPERIPPVVAEWLQQYQRETQKPADDQVNAEAIREEWDRLKNRSQKPGVRSQDVGASESRKTGDSDGEGSVEPLISTKWNQTLHYNALCPGQSMTGCVATSMAQVMKYWNHPVQGIGSHTYEHEVYGTLSADFEDTSYRWEQMPDRLTTPNDAVALLIYHCGVSVNTNYNFTSSDAYALSYHSPTKNTAEYALKTYFGYSHSLRGILRKDYSDIQWISLLKKELRAGRPFIYTGYNPEEGHTFVCDGYDNQDYFHFNWGWGGNYNGYFYINALDPKGNHNGYADDHQVIIGIEPAQHSHPESPLSDQIKIYPTVVNDHITIDLHDFYGIIREVILIDSQGKQIPSTDIVDTTEKLQLHTSGIPSGLYFLRLRSDKGTLTTRIILQH